MSNSHAESLSADRLRALIAKAVLAPSSHNTQPWRFRLTEEGIVLYADRRRALPVNDPDDRELVISCGCALMNLRIAAANAAMNAQVELRPDPANRDLLAAISLTVVNGSAAAESCLFPFIEKRRTYRKAFEARAVPGSVTDSLAKAAADEGAWLQFIGSEGSRRAIADLVAEGDAMQWSNPAWRRELAAWMHPRSRGDGLTVPDFVASIARAVVRALNMGKAVGSKDAQLAKASPVIAVLGTGGDSVEEWLHAGQALERVLLTARSNGLQASYLNQPIQVASLRPKLQSLQGRSGLPQILLRLGFPASERDATPRRKLDDVVSR